MNSNAQAISKGNEDRTAREAGSGLPRTAPGESAGLAVSRGRRARNAKVLFVGPKSHPGNYIGGITILISLLLRDWNIPYRLSFFNTDIGRRAYGSSNKLNLTNARRFIQTAAALIRFSRREKPALVHFHTSRHLALMKDLVLVALMKQVMDSKFVGHVHSASYRHLLIGSSRLAHRLQLWWLAHSFDRIILLSEQIKTDVISDVDNQSGERLQKKISVLYNCAELPALRERAEKPGDLLTVFFIGNVGRAKGIFELIAATARIRQAGTTPFRVVLAGPFDSPDVGEEVRRQIRLADVDEEIKLAGLVVGEQKERLFRDASIFVLPSYGEGLPMSMLEAMSYSLPVVATRVGAIPEVVRDGQEGFLVEPGNVEQLFTAILKLLRSKPLRQSMGNRGRARVEQNHTTTAYLRSLASIYDELLNDVDASQIRSESTFDAEERLPSHVT